LDDLQWAVSIDALHHLARRVAPERLLVLGTYREAELMEKPALARAILSMNRERLFHSLPLKRLAEGEVAQMVAQALSRDDRPVAPAGVTEVVYQKTGGNPFFVEEVVHYLMGRGAVVLGREGWEVRDVALVDLPVSVRAVVGERLEKLGEEAQGVLAWAAVVGQEFTLPLLQEVAGLEEEMLLEVVDQAVAARVLVPGPSLRQETYAFVDEVVRDVLYEGIGPARRRRYHLKVGQGIEQVQARHLEEHYDALAHHFLEGNDLQKAAEYSLRSGDRASNVYSWERAIAHYRTTLELMDELEASPRQQAEVLDRLGKVMRFGRGKGAQTYFGKALVLYEAIGDRVKTAEMHLESAQQYLHEAGVHDIESAYTQCLKAIALMEHEGESRQLARAYEQLGYFAARLPNEPLSNGIALMEKGMALAERLSSVAEATEAATWLGMTLSAHAGQVKRGLELAHKGCELAKMGGDPAKFGFASGLLSFCYSSLLDAENTLRWAEEAVESCSRVGTFRDSMAATLLISLGSIQRGDVRRALSNLDNAQQLAQRLGFEISRFIHGGVVAPGLVHFYLGDWDKAETELLKCLETGRQSHHAVMTPWVTRHLGALYLEQGDLARAQSQLREALTVCEVKDYKLHEMVSRALLAQVDVKAGKLEKAAAHLRRAQEILSNGENWRGLAAEVHHAEGVLAAAQQRWDEAEGAFQKAVEINRQYHLPYYEARSLMEWGEMYLSRAGGGAVAVWAGLALPGQGAASSAPTRGIPVGQHKELGLELLAQALAIFQRIQAKKMVEKVVALQEKANAVAVGATRRVAPTYPDGLTQREIEVLRLIALGKSNREIAAELFISLNTVGHHVSNILNKTGTANRAGVATYAARQGLLSS
jgi:DNA-binding CsgD family transcriptional regulator